MGNVGKGKYLDWLPIGFPQILEVHAIERAVCDFLSPTYVRGMPEHNPHKTAETQISPTEWGRAVRVIRRLEKALRELVHLEELAPIAHEILLTGDALNPLAVVRVRCRPERHLVILASQVHERYRETRLASTPL